MSEQGSMNEFSAGSAVIREPVFQRRRRPRYVRLAEHVDIGSPTAPGSVEAIRRPNRVEATILKSLNFVLAVGALIVLSPFAGRSVQQ